MGKYIIKSGGRTDEDAEEKINLLQYIDLVSKGISGTSYQGGSVYVIDESEKWFAFQFKTSQEVNIQVGDLHLSRIDGFYVNKFRIYQGANFYTVRTQNNEKGFVFPSLATTYASYWFGGPYTLRIVHKLQTSPIKTAPALNKIWNMNGEKFKISLPLKLKFNDYFTVSGGEDVTGIYAVLDNGTYDINFMVKGAFPIFDYTNNRIDFGMTNWRKYVNIGNYLGNSNFYHEKIKIELPSISGSSRYYNNLDTRLKLENVYFNSEDILDEKGNIILAKNCDISDFL